jgi:hypothetical protein
VSECNNLSELTNLITKPRIAKTIEQDFVAKKKLLQVLTSNISSNGNGTH